MHLIQNLRPCAMLTAVSWVLESLFLRASLTLQEIRSIQDPMNIPKIEFIS